MASWGALLALTGFHYSAVTSTLRFAASPTPVTWFWSNGDTWGTVTQTPDSATGTVNVALSVRGSASLSLRRLEITGVSIQAWDTTQMISSGETVQVGVGV
jgi:hypothetical protein